LTVPAETVDLQPVTVGFKLMLLTNFILQILYAYIAEFDYLAATQTEQVVVMSMP